MARLVPGAVRTPLPRIGRTRLDAHARPRPHRGRPAHAHGPRTGSACGGRGRPGAACPGRPSRRAARARACPTRPRDGRRPVRPAARDPRASSPADHAGRVSPERSRSCGRAGPSSSTPAPCSPRRPSPPRGSTATCTRGTCTARATTSHSSTSATACGPTPSSCSRVPYGVVTSQDAVAWEDVAPAWCEVWEVEQPEFELLWRASGFTHAVNRAADVAPGPADGHRAPRWPSGATAVDRPPDLACLTHETGSPAAVAVGVRARGVARGGLHRRRGRPRALDARRAAYRQRRVPDASPPAPALVVADGARRPGPGRPAGLALAAALDARLHDHGRPATSRR